MAEWNSRSCLLCCDLANPSVEELNSGHIVIGIKMFNLDNVFFFEKVTNLSSYHSVIRGCSWWHRFFEQKFTWSGRKLRCTRFAEILHIISFFHKRCSFWFLPSMLKFSLQQVVKCNWSWKTKWCFLSHGRAVCCRASGKRENLGKTSTPLRVQNLDLMAINC